MKEHNKRWLMSMLKTSGSKRYYVENGRYADERNNKTDSCLENLPQHESIKSTREFYNGKVNLGPLVRFLRQSAGQNWNEVHSEIISRIPTKMLDYKHAIFWFVADKVEFRDGKLWNRQNRRYIWRAEDSEFFKTLKYPENLDLIEFYVDPDSNQLIHIPLKSFKHIKT